MEALTDGVHIHATRQGTTVVMRKTLSQSRKPAAADAGEALSAIS